MVAAASSVANYEALLANSARVFVEVVYFVGLSWELLFGKSNACCPRTA
jgi:hypothetical protein